MGRRISRVSRDVRPAACLAALALASLPSAVCAQEPLIGVEAARSARGGVVVWSERELFVGDAEASSFRALPLAQVLDVAVEDDGALLISRRLDLTHEVVELVRPDGTIERVREGGVRVLAAGAGVLAFLDDEGVVWRSDDGGRRWSQVVAPAPCESCEPVSSWGADLAIGADGSLVMVDVEINTCGSSDRLEWQRWMHAPRGRPFAQRDIVLSRDDHAASWRVGAFGWAYGVSYADRLVATSGEEARVIAPASSRGEPTLAQNGRATIVLAAPGLLQVEGSRSRVLDASPPEIEDLALDVRGRPLAIVEGTLRRFRRRTGWEVVFGPR